MPCLYKGIWKQISFTHPDRIVGSYSIITAVD
jgi:hypothetical protein